MRVVVGVSGRSASPGALRWAVATAAATGGHVVAVRAWRPLPTQSGSRGTPSAVVPDQHAQRLDAESRLVSDVRDVLGSDHGVEVRLVAGGRRKALLASAADADLLVVDAPRAGTTPGFLPRLLNVAGCPVVVIPRPLSGFPETSWRRAAGNVGLGIAEAAGRTPRPGLGQGRPPTQD